MKKGIAIAIGMLALTLLSCAAWSRQWDIEDSQTETAQAPTRMPLTLTPPAHALATQEAESQLQAPTRMPLTLTSPAAMQAGIDGIAVYAGTYTASYDVPDFSTNEVHTDLCQNEGEAQLQLMNDGTFILNFGKLKLPTVGSGSDCGGELTFLLDGAYTRDSNQLVLKNITTSTGTGEETITPFEGSANKDDYIFNVTFTDASAHGEVMLNMYLIIHLDFDLERISN